MKKAKREGGWAHEEMANETFPMMRMTNRLFKEPLSSLSFKLFPSFFFSFNTGRFLLLPDLAENLANTPPCWGHTWWGEEAGGVQKGRGAGRWGGGGSRGRGAELARWKETHSHPFPTSKHIPGNLRDAGRGLIFMPFLGQGFEQNSFIYQKVGRLQKVEGSCKVHEGQEWGSSENTVQKDTQHPKVTMLLRLRAIFLFLFCLSVL